MGEAIVLQDLIGDVDTESLIDLTGDDILGPGGGAPKVVLIDAG